MKKLLCYFILGASAQIAHAESAQIANEYSRSERYVYLNANLIGYFPVCVDNRTNEFFFPDEFFEQVALTKSKSTAQCNGHRYTSPLVAFVRNDAAGTLSATTTQDNFIGLPKNSDSAASSTLAQDREARAKTVVIPASSLQHALGLTHDASGGSNMTLSAGAQYYTDAGLFAIEGVAASESGKTQSYIRDINWKRHFADSATNGTFGLSTISSPGSAIRLYGFVLGSDEDSISNNSSQTIDGFADMFGKIQIRSRGILLKEVPVSVGNFSISTADLPASSGTPGQYTLSLVDDSGRIVRSWDVFVPIGARLLRPGRSTWSVFTGQIESNLNNNSLLGGQQNLGAGFTYSYGINAWLTADTFSVVSPHVKGIGVSTTVAPMAWLSANAGRAQFAGADQGGVSTFGGVDVHLAHVGAATNYTRLDCAAQYGGNSLANGTSSSQCSTMYSSLYAFHNLFGRLSVQHTQNNHAWAKSSNNGFTWTPPNFGRASLSIYGNRFNDSTSPVASTSYGFTLTLPFGRGQLMNNATYSSPNSSNIATSYQESVNNEFQYSVTAEGGNTSSTSLRSTVQYRPWYGSFQANAQVGERGQQSIGLNESGAIVFAEKQVLLTQENNFGYAIIHLDKLSDLPLENSAGQRQAVINKQGYAAIAVAHGSEPGIRVSAEELPDNIHIAGNLVGRISDNWQATLWAPAVRTVNKGWARLMFSKDNPVSLGASLRLIANEEATYVLGAGDIYFDDFPENAKHVEVMLPGNSERCFVDFPDHVELPKSYLPGKPEFTCTFPSLN